MGVTQRDVAARAGVSPVVVSRVLHNRARTVRVSAATAERVRRAAEELNYRLNVSASNFRKQQTHAIGILHGLGFTRIGFETGSRYFSALVEGMIDGAFEYGYSLTFCPKLLGEDAADAMGDGRFDGLVWYSATRNETSRKIMMECQVPLVAIHARGADVAHGRPTVICDNDNGIRQAVDHLISLGHRRIAFASDHFLTNSENVLREEAYHRHMAAHGLPTSNDDVVHIDPERQVMDAFLCEGPIHTALICYNEGVAGEFIQRAAHFGVRIPEDLSIVGFDSTSFCNEFRPRITCISQPIKEIGRTAIELLVGVMRGDPEANREVVFPCGFDVRESTCAPRCV